MWRSVQLHATLICRLVRTQMTGGIANENRSYISVVDAQAAVRRLKET